MKPRYPLIQPFDRLPRKIPVCTLENALLPGGELPLEFSKPDELALFIGALRSDQLVGMVQPRRDSPGRDLHRIGCAGRIRQYRIIDEARDADGYTVATVDWSGFESDYLTEEVGPGRVAGFKETLRSYFDRHNMQVDWNVLDQLPIEQVVNNLVLVINLDIDSKQRLLEAPTVAQRVELFAKMLTEKVNPILVSSADDALVN